ncbi:MAG TPA: OsmC family protein [Candidatus Binatia bacterium]
MASAYQAKNAWFLDYFPREVAPTVSHLYAFDQFKMKGPGTTTPREKKTMSNDDTDRINGFRREDLNLLKRGLQSHPDNTKFKLRAKNRWIDGAQSLSLVSGFHGMGREFTARSTPFIQTTDTPPVLLGKDGGPSPMEHLLVALASSVTTSLAYRAAFAGVQILEIECEVEGDFDIQPVMANSAATETGFRQIRVTVHVKSDASKQQLAELCAASPVLETLARPVPVSITVEKN